MQPENNEDEQTLTTFEANLQAQFGAIKRPSFDDFARYQLGIADEATNQTVAAYLKAFPAAQRQFEAIEAQFKTPPPDANTIWQRATDVVKYLLTLTPAPLTTNIRAQGVGQEHIYQGEGVYASLSITEDITAVGYYALYGFVETTHPIDQAELWLPTQPDPLATALVEMGDFTLSHLIQGQYDLLLIGPEVKIHIPNIVI